MGNGYVRGLQRQVKLIAYVLCILYMHICICTWEMSMCVCMYGSVYLMSIWSESQMGVDAWKWTNTQTLISSCGECDSTAGNNPKPEQNFKELWTSQTTNGCVQPHRARAAATATATTLPHPSFPLQPLSPFGSRNGRSCRTKGFKLLVETTSTASFEWMATNGRNGSMERRKDEQEEWGQTKGGKGLRRMRMRMWMWG